MSDNHSNIFDAEYKLFEDRFRGSETAIRQRLSVYLPLLAGLAATPETGRKALDLGSGRGEWLRLLSEHGWTSIGIEPNDIAEAAHDIDATIIRADALEYLCGCNDDSFALVTAFHVVEHLETDYLLRTLRQIRRVLAPGGLMILETPNPENLTVASWSFHLDPTHKAPIPPVLMQYYADAAGFVSSEIVRLNGTQGGYEFGPQSAILSVLFRSGPDYAIIARKSGADDELFSGLIKNFGFQNSQRNPADVQFLIELAKITDNVVENQGKLIANFSEIQSALDQKTRELHAVYNSSSWRISRPIRGLVRLARSGRSKILQTRRVCLARLRKQLRRRPKLTANLIAAMHLIPPVKRRLKAFVEPRTRTAFAWSLDVDPQKLAAWEESTHEF